MPTLSRITVYPIKSLDGLELDSSEVLSNGALANDRRYALVDAWGKYVNGKTCVEIHRIRATFSEDASSVSLSCEGNQASFDLGGEQEVLAAWCGEVLGKKCRLIENADGGYPDDCESPGPTLVSTSSLEQVADWYEGVDLAEVRRRFRFNMEVADVPPFWEDGLVGAAHEVRRFRVGKLVWQGNGVCQRCVVPTRGSLDGTVTAGFAKEFSRLRQESLPGWATIERFDHFFRLGANTRLDSDDDGSVIQLGDVVELVS